MLAISDNAHFEYSDLLEWGHYVTLKHFSFSLLPQWYREQVQGVWVDVLTALLMKMHVFWWTRKLEYWKEGRKDNNKQNKKNFSVRPRSLFIQLRGDRNICTWDVYQNIFCLLHIKGAAKLMLLTGDRKIKYSTCYDYTLYLYVQNTGI